MLQAGRAGAPIAAVVLAGWSLTFPGLEPRFSQRCCEQLQRSADQYDRLAGAGASAELIVGRMARPDVDAAQGHDVQTVAFYVTDLKAAARALRRWKTGRPPPRLHYPRVGGRA